jgi:hypothetical protein
MAGVLTNKKKRKIGRPKEVPGDLTPKTIYFEVSRYREFKELCDENGLPLSDAIRTLVDHELEQTAITTIGVAYGKEAQPIDNQDLLSLKLDHYMTDEEAMNKVESIPIDRYHEAFAACRKIMDRLDFKMNRKFSPRTIKK